MTDTPRLTLLTGGARSGKSRRALELASARAGDAVTFIATAEPRDADMEARIARHRAERNPAWETLEAPYATPRALRAARGALVLLDCITLYVANLLLDPGGPVHAGDAGEEAVERGIDELVVAWRQTGKPLIAVTNEVGWGIIPDNALSRRYGDALGRANQVLMQHATEAYLMIAGEPLRIKGGP